MIAHITHRVDWVDVTGPQEVGFYVSNNYKHVKPKQIRNPLWFTMAFKHSALRSRRRRNVSN